MSNRINESLFYRLARIIHKLTRPRMIGRRKNFQGKKVIDSSIGNTTFIDFPENLYFGNNTYIGHHNFIEASNGIEIGDGCQITDFVSITTHSSHNSIRFYGNKFDRKLNLVGYVKGKILIGKFTFIGPHSTIMPNTTIGKGSIIAAYSYVKGEFPDFAIISGNPATVIGDTRIMDAKYLANNSEIQAYYDNWSKK